MGGGYDILFKVGRFFVGRYCESRQLFLGKNCKGYYVSLTAGDLVPFRRRQTTTAFWKELFR